MIRQYKVNIFNNKIPIRLEKVEHAKELKVSAVNKGYAAAFDFAYGS